MGIIREIHLSSDGGGGYMGIPWAQHLWTQQFPKGVVQQFNFGGWSLLRLEYIQGLKNKGGGYFCVCFLLRFTLIKLWIMY